MGITQIYLIRHGESVGNEKNVFIGHTDVELTSTGYMQAQMAAEYLKDIDADVIYSSDLLRAYHTAVPTADRKGMVIQKNKNLREIFAGDWENQPFDYLQEKDRESYGVWLHNIGRACCPGGESVEQLQKRFVSEVETIAKENVGKAVFIFTHSTPLRVLKAAWENKTLDEIKDIPWASNASVTRAEYSDGVFRMVDYGVDSFLGDMVTIPPDNV